MKWAEAVEAREYIAESRKAHDDLAAWREAEDAEEKFFRERAPGYDAQADAEAEAEDKAKDHQA